MLRIIEVTGQDDLKTLMQCMQVDSYGTRIMAPKGISHIVKIESLSGIAANIFKQEMLSLGADAAIARDAITGKARITGCLAMGNLSQFNRLIEKLKKQPFGLNKLSAELSSSLENYKKINFPLKAGKYSINIGRKPLIMGIINLTPDSFSGDGLLAGQRLKTKDQSLKTKKQMINYVVEFAHRLIKEGADIIDIGGESSRPGAAKVSAKDEAVRIVPIIKILARKIKVPISVDTHKPEVARKALDNGASMINDITGLTNPKMANIISRYGASAVIMHMKGTPRTMQKNPQYSNLIEEISAFLRNSIDKATASGIKEENIIIDPGLGFGKTIGHNLEIINRLREFKVLGKPILIGPSRKFFIGKILNAPAQERIFGTVSACVLAVRNGANIVRVHDVKAVKQALKVAQAIINN